jgi:hypothetical protein
MIGLDCGLDEIVLRDFLRPGPSPMADREVDNALARSFLAGLPRDLVCSLRSEGNAQIIRRARLSTGPVRARRRRWWSRACSVFL